MIIKEIRDALQLSQNQFANEIGVSFATVNRWENGKTEPGQPAQNRIFQLTVQNDIPAAQIIYDKIRRISEAISDTNQKQLLYHGSKSGIKGKITPSSRSRCDFGKGFYMGTIPEQPLTLTCDFQNSKFYILSVDFSKLKQVMIPPDINWALIVALNRGKMETIKHSQFYKRIADLTESCDVISGSIANDRMFYVLDQFFQGNITDVALINSLSALNLGQQFVAVTQKACDCIQIEKEIELSYLEKLILKSEAEQNRQTGISLANKICRAHRREGLYFDEIIANQTEAPR